MVAKRERKYNKTDPEVFKRIVSEKGRDVKVLSSITGLSSRQVVRNLRKLDEGKEIGKRGYGKHRSLSGLECEKFMWMKYEKMSRNEIEKELDLSDSKCRRIEKLVEIPNCVKLAQNSIAVEVCGCTDFNIIWQCEESGLKVSFNQFFEGLTVQNHCLCLELIKVIAQGYENDDGKSITFFDEIEGRKVEKLENPEERFNYYMNYFNKLSSKLEMMEEVRRYFGLMRKDVCVIQELNNNPVSDFEDEDVHSVNEGICSESDSDINSESENEDIHKDLEEYSLMEEDIGEDDVTLPKYDDQIPSLTEITETPVEKEEKEGDTFDLPDLQCLYR